MIEYIAQQLEVKPSQINKISPLGNGEYDIQGRDETGRFRFVLGITSLSEGFHEFARTDLSNAFSNAEQRLG